MRGLLIVLFALFGPVSASAQQSRSPAPQVALGVAAERARAAWARHDASGLVAGTPRLQLQLPGADPSAALGPAQASALLSDYFAQAQEVATTVRAARETEPGRGYVEVQRRYRVAGTQEVRTQTLLLGYRLEAGGWQLVELRVIG